MKKGYPQQSYGRPALLLIGDKGMNMGQSGQSLDRTNKPSWRYLVIETLVAAVLSSAVVGVIASALLTRYTEEVTLQVRQQFEQSLVRFRSNIEWKEKALSELLGPVVMQLDRTQIAFDRWTSDNLYLEAKIIKEGNQTIRDLLLSKGHLIPPDLLEHADSLIEHYDRWLEEFDHLRGSRDQRLDEPFVFVGTKGYPFPRRSADLFRQRFREMWSQLYGRD
ncbi:MAG TPA: hypothetical protein VN285_06575 [Candidatus Deferrimicrobium sp.]|nr:hypothetical protein [Candidatus Deferrimicrobium sp.]